MSGLFLYLALGLPALALLMGGGALVLTRLSHDRYKDALLAERSDAAAAR